MTSEETWKALMLFKLETTNKQNVIVCRIFKGAAKTKGINLIPGGGGVTNGNIV